MILLEAYCTKALEMGLTGAKVIDPRSVVTAEWVRMKCQFGCTGFGMSLCCPPHTPAPEVTRKVIDSYTKAILLHRRMEKGKRAKDLTQIVIHLER
jgi:predicted metal-binding protein